MDTREPTVLDLVPSWVGALVTLGLAVALAVGAFIGALVAINVSLPGILVVVAGILCAVLLGGFYVRFIELTLGAKYRNERRNQS